jgi:hypothetical protein
MLGFNLALVFHFQQNDHPTILDAMAHVETSITPFHVALQDTHVMSPKIIRSHVFPFESLVVQSYPQMQSSLMDQLHEQEFTLLLANVPLNVVQAHLHSCIGLTTRVWLLDRLNTPSFCLSSIHFLIALCIHLNIPDPIIVHFS